RRIALGRDRNGQRSAVDDRRRVEIALGRNVDDVDRDTPAPRRELRCLGVRAGLGEEHQGCVIEHRWLETAFCTDCTGKVVQSCTYPAKYDDRSSRLKSQPGLVAGFFSIADDDDAPTLDFVADGECVQFTHARPFEPSYSQ